MIHYLVMQEHKPHCTTRSKQFSAKVVLLAAMAHSRWDNATNKPFDGKLGI